MKKKGLILIAGFLVTAFCAACASVSSEPPQDLVNEIEAIESKYAETSAQYSPGSELTAEYQAAVSRARSALEAGDYKEAGKSAQDARVELAQLQAKLVYQNLLEYNPSNSLTYHYRKAMKDSEDAEEEGKIEQALAAAQEAYEQAELALELQEQCIEDAGKSLKGLKSELEQMYRPTWEMTELYWSAVDVLSDKDCARVRSTVERLVELIRERRETTIATSRSFIVTSPDEFIKIYGNPVMYAEVTPQGLRGQVNRVRVGTRVLFIRSKWVSRDTVYYYVEDTATGTKGWMAEERVWPERAARRKR